MIENMSAGKAKKKAKERDGWECRFCGMTNEEHLDEYDRGVHAHHIIKESDNGADNPRNLITVCRPCHDILEETQADALSRLRNEHTNEDRVKELEMKVQQLEEKNKQLRKNRVPVDELEAAIEDMSLGRDARHKSISVETVTATLGYDCGVYTDSEQAREEYEEWGGALKRNSVSVPDDVVDDIVVACREAIREELPDEVLR